MPTIPRRGFVLLTVAVLLSFSLTPVYAGAALALTTPYPAVAVAAGSDVSFDVSVTGAPNQRVALSLAGTPAGWSASLRGGGLVVDAIQTDASGKAAVEVAVSVPADAVAGTTRITLSASAGSSQASLALDVRVSDEAAGSVTLTTNILSLQGTAGTTFTFNLTLHNDTSEDKTFAVTATGPAGWAVNATLTGQQQAASAVVVAGGTSGITVTAVSPDQVDAGTYPIQVQAAVGDETIGAELGVVITGTNRLVLSTPDQSLSNRGSAGGTITQQLVLSNEGTADLSNVTITASMPRDWTVTYDPSDAVATLAAGESVTVTASIVPSNDAIAGDYVVSFDATGGDVSDSVDIRMTIETSPIWGFVGIGLIVAVLAGLWWVFRKYGRR